MYYIRRIHLAKWQFVSCNSTMHDTRMNILSVLFAFTLLAAASSAREILQSGNTFPSGLIVGENATCDSESVGTLRFDSESGALHLCVNSGWSVVNQVSSDLNALLQQNQELQSRVLSLENLGIVCSQENSTLDNQILCEVRELSAKSLRVQGRMLCNGHGRWNDSSEMCDCDCSWERGCWEPLSLCSNCLAGYSGEYCQEDPDECSTGAHECSEHASCVNTFESYSCQCNTGFEGNGLACVDIDECNVPSLITCHANATCVNTEGSAYCQCIPGFGMIGDGFTCVEGCGLAESAPGKSCRAIRDLCNETNSGAYWIDFEGTAPSTEVYCDMETDGGGWTQVFATQRTPNAFPGVAAEGTLILTDNGFATPNQHAKYADSWINAILTTQTDHYMMIKSKHGDISATVTWDAIFRFSTTKLFDATATNANPTNLILGSDAANQEWILSSPAGDLAIDNTEVATHPDVVSTAHIFSLSSNGRGSSWVMSSACNDGYTGPYVTYSAWNCYTNSLKMFVKDMP